MAEAPDGPLNRLKEQVNCPVCLDVFRQPKVLICTHAFCIDCIDHLPVDLVDGDHKIYCPTCREPTTLPRNGSTASLRPAFLINTLIELYHTMKATAIPAHEEGQPLPAQVHDDKCPEHDRLLELYCEDCEVLVCSHCDRDDHHDHDCGYIADVFDRQHQEIGDRLGRTSQRAQAVLNALDALNTQQEQITAQGDIAKNEIDATIARLIQAIEQSGTTLKDHVDSLVQDKLIDIAAEIKKGQMALVSLKSCEQYIQDRLSHASQQEILQEKRNMIERLSAADEESTHVEVKESEEIAFQQSQDILERCGEIGKVGITETRALTETPDDSLAQSDTFSNAIVKSQHMVAIHGKPSAVYIYIPSATARKQNNLTCQLVSDDGGVVTQCKMKQVNKSRHQISFTAHHQGLHHVKLSFKGVDIPVPCKVQVASTIPGLHHPMAVASATAAAGPLLVAEEGGNIIAIDKESHAVVHRSVNRGGGSNRGICATPDNHILVMSSHAPHVTKYSQEDFTLVGVADTAHGSGPLQFKKPRGIAVDSDTLVYICDTNNHRIQVLTPELEFHREFGGQGNGRGQFCNPHDLAIDPQDNTLYVCDHDNKRIQKLASDGTYIDEFVMTASPRYIVLESASRMLYVTMKDHVTVLTCDGELIDEKPRLNAKGCTGVATDEERVYVCDRSNNQIIVM